MPDQPVPRISRRRFCSSVAAATTVAAPVMLLASKSSSQLIVGSGDHQFEVLHDWPQLPEPFRWQTTHNVAVDRAGHLYVIHEGHADKPDHPSIFVFDAEGKYVRSFGSQFQGGGHGIEVRVEDGQEFLYVCAYQQVKAIAKLDLKGEVVWLQHAPMESGIYAAGEDTHPEKIWGRDRFMPTNTAFLPDGGFLVADGYGSYYIHHYDSSGKWLRCLGGPGEGEGTFDTPHGLWVDARQGQPPHIVVADRAHHQLQFLTLDGQHVRTVEGFGLPANMDTFGSLMVVPELLGRVTLLDLRDNVVTHLGDDSARISSDTKHSIRSDPRQWLPGKFVHPHDACFDREGNLFVAEWVATGRVTKLKRLS